MKLPEEFGKSEIDTANDLRIAEALVRDCATFVDSWEHLDPAVSYQLTEIKKALMQRYGLEEKQT